MSGVEIAFVISDFEIFEPRPIQTSVLRTVEIMYKTIAPYIRKIWNF